MPDEKLTTIQVDVNTRDRLKELAAAFERTTAGQLRWMVNQEYKKFHASLPSAKERKTGPVSKESTDEA